MLLMPSKRSAIFAQTRYNVTDNITNASTLNFLVSGVSPGATVKLKRQRRRIPVGS